MACGQALGALGDPRFDPEPRHLPADPTLVLREVPAGPFRMGTDPERDPDGRSDEEPQHDQEPESQGAARRFRQGVAAGQLQPGLPTEPEWEKAARGTEARIYACGNTLTPDLANYKDTGLKGTSAVGCFPDGTCPCGCEDQTGNVWCRRS